MPQPIHALGSEYLLREGLDPAPAAWEDGLRLTPEHGNFEWWYFDAHLSEGSTAVVTFATKPLLKRREILRPLVAVNLTRPDGTQIRKFSTFAPDKFHAARAQCDVSIGDNWCGGDLNTYRLHTQDADLELDLTLTRLAPAWRPGAGKTYYSRDLTRYFAWLPSVPFGSVKGSLTYDGQTHLVSGTGYHDHNWGTIGLEQVMSRWYWGRVHLDGYTLIFAEMATNRAWGRVKLPVFYLAKDDHIITGDGLPLVLEGADFVRHHEGKSYPQQLNLEWERGMNRIRVRFSHPQVLEASSLLGGVNSWIRRLARLFANPYYFRLQTELEIFLDFPGMRQTLTGSGLYEIMFLR